MNGIIFVCLWIASIPVGYLSCRWINRVSGLTAWTRMDHLGAILFAMIYGPLMPLIGAVVVLIQKLSETGWAKRDAKW